MIAALLAWLGGRHCPWCHISYSDDLGPIDKLYNMAYKKMPSLTLHFGAFHTWFAVKFGMKYHIKKHLVGVPGA